MVILLKHFNHVSLCLSFVAVCCLLSMLPGLSSAEDPVKIPNQMSEVKIVNKVSAAYPQIAKDYFAQASVIVDVTIGVDGSVTKAEVSNCNIAYNDELRKKVEATQKPGEITEDPISKMAREEKVEEAFKSSALDAAKQWKFEPITSGGKAISLVYPLEFKFSLGDKKDQEKKEQPSQGEGQQGAGE